MYSVTIPNYAYFQVRERYDAFEAARSLSLREFGSLVRVQDGEGKLVGEVRCGAAVTYQRGAA